MPYRSLTGRPLPNHDPAQTLQPQPLPNADPSANLRGRLEMLAAQTAGGGPSLPPELVPAGLGSPAPGLVGTSPVAPLSPGGGFGLGVGGGPGGAGGFTPGPPGRDFGGTDLSPDLLTKRGITGVAPAVRRLAAAERRFDVDLPVVSDYRSSAEQAALYQQHLAGQHPAPVAPPGQSYHEQGEAFDITASWLAQHPEVRRFLVNRGFTFDVPGEPWHAHFVGGGRPISRTPSSPSTTNTTGSNAGPRRSRSRPSPPASALARRRRYTV